MNNERRQLIRDAMNRIDDAQGLLTQAAIGESAAIEKMVQKFSSTAKFISSEQNLYSLNCATDELKQIRISLESVLE